MNTKKLNERSELKSQMDTLRAAREQRDLESTLAHSEARPDWERQDGELEAAEEEILRLGEHGDPTEHKLREAWRTRLRALKADRARLLVRRDEDGRPETTSAPGTSRAAGGPKER